MNAINYSDLHLKLTLRSQTLENIKQKQRNEIGVVLQEKHKKTSIQLVKTVTGGTLFGNLEPFCEQQGQAGGILKETVSVNILMI